MQGMVHRPVLTMWSPRKDSSGLSRSRVKLQRSLLKRAAPSRWYGAATAQQRWRLYSTPAAAGTCSVCCGAAVKIACALTPLMPKELVPAAHPIHVSPRVHCFVKTFYSMTVLYFPGANFGKQISSYQQPSSPRLEMNKGHAAEARWVPA